MRGFLQLSKSITDPLPIISSYVSSFIKKKTQKVLQEGKENQFSSLKLLSSNLLFSSIKKFIMDQGTFFTDNYLTVKIIKF